MPEVAPEDQEIVRVHEWVKDQIITDPNKGRHLNYMAVKMVMDLYGIRDQKRCFEQVVKLFKHFLATD